jgi:hypothetical protein
MGAAFSRYSAEDTMLFTAIVNTLSLAVASVSAATQETESRPVFPAAIAESAAAAAVAVGDNIPVDDTFSD